MVEFDGETRAVMSEEVQTVEASCSVGEAAELLLSEGIGSVVVDAEPLGVVTKTDLVAGLRDGVDPETTPVSELMTPRPATVDPDTPLRETVAAMDDQGVKRLPVTDEGSVVGIVTTTDLVAAAAADANASAGVFEATITVSGVDIYECVRCGSRLTDEAHPGDCPDCEGAVRNIGVARE